MIAIHPCHAQFLVLGNAAQPQARCGPINHRCCEHLWRIAMRTQQARHQWACRAGTGVVVWGVVWVCGAVCVARGKAGGAGGVVVVCLGVGVGVGV